MAETLGSLCDKLTIVKLKQWHSEDPARQESLAAQEVRLRGEIDEFISAVLSGALPVERLVFAANKVYKQEGNAIRPVIGTIGAAFAQLAAVNCELWHEQEKVYDFENVPVEAKNRVVKQLALLNLQRTDCIDHIDRGLRDIILASAQRSPTDG
jgi:hypothetical protein